MRTNGHLLITSSAALALLILVLHLASTLMAATHGAVG